MWGRELDGLTLTFHLAGINNQNFLMRDEQTGSYWQQISGRAISGPLAGKALRRIPADELTFALWRAEESHGTVLKDVPAYVSQYSPKNWEVRMKKAPVVLSYAENGRTPRDLMLGIHASGAARAFPYEIVVRQGLVLDHVGSEPVLLVTGPDGESVRAFKAQIPGLDGLPGFYRIPGPNGAIMMDAATGSRWNFQGCSTEGKAKGACLEREEVIKDYWFDWRHYNPATTVYSPPGSK